MVSKAARLVLVGLAWVPGIQFAAQLLGALVLVSLSLERTWGADSAGLAVESKIPLGDVHGRIDHLAVDLNRQRLYVAELGNDSLGVVDLKERKTIRTLTGLREPQGIGYAPSTDTVYVANAGDGSVRLFQGADLTPSGQIALGGDADNIRVDDAAHRVFVGYGDGALAVIDTTNRTRIADIRLKAHPESFQLEREGPHIFVNVPDAHEIALVDRSANQQIASWPTRELHANFPMALDESRGRLLVVFRHPARVGVSSVPEGKPLLAFDTCGDSDDVFVDAKRHRVYVICGEGFVDVFAEQVDGYARIARLGTVSGARTGLFVPAIDTLLVAVRASLSAPASIWVLRPTPVGT
jgi:hypothetical protein